MTVEQFKVTSPDGDEHTGTRSVKNGTMTVRADDGREQVAEVRRTDPEWLSKTLLLELYGSPRIRWPKDWNPT